MTVGLYAVVPFVLACSDAARNPVAPLRTARTARLGDDRVSCEAAPGDGGDDGGDDSDESIGAPGLGTGSATPQCGGDGDGGDDGGDGGWGDDGGDGGDDGGAGDVYTADDGTTYTYADGLTADSLCTSTGQRCDPRKPDAQDSSAAQRSIQRLLNSPDGVCAGLGQTLQQKVNSQAVQFYDQQLWSKGDDGYDYQTVGLAFIPGKPGSQLFSGQILIYSNGSRSQDKQHVMFHEAAHFRYGAGDTRVSNPTYPYGASAEQIATYCDQHTDTP